MDTDLIVTKATLLEVVDAVLTLPHARRVADGILFQGEQGVKARTRFDGATSVVVYDRESGNLANQVYEVLVSRHPAAAIIQYDDEDEILRANHPRPRSCRSSASQVPTKGVSRMDMKLIQVADATPEVVLNTITSMDPSASLGTTQAGSPVVIFSPDATVTVSENVEDGCVDLDINDLDDPRLPIAVLRTLGRQGIVATLFSENADVIASTA
ncbi:hypothetical protein [Enemella evansiae]|uniref:hypothetical protein n=1 Tax=Enemella evansiae TaxID=2016499 RepID=UPI000B971C4E|nr:hypothetical protein [Enemella evansiae]OYO03382.1 hypothetical protein CGZ97_07930 [Enemella evansiae]OYO09801.1 hypothetical protein CGZ98_11735 [Enemella evansiae]